MKLHELRPSEGSRKKRKRLGRGMASGHGKTSGKGHKGQGARSGGGVRPGFEGGQNPLYRRLPKRGFTNHTRKEYEIVNVSLLNNLDENTLVTPEVLLDLGIVNKMRSGIKILGNGDLDKKLTIRAHKFSKTAQDKILAVGGTMEVI